MVVVDVDDLGFRRDRLGYLVGVLVGGQAGADVEELPDPGLAGQVLDRAAQERPVGPHPGQDVRVGLQRLLSGLPVGGEVVLAAQLVVVHAGGCRR